jgi:hypothetical protein
MTILTYFNNGGYYYANFHDSSGNGFAESTWVGTSIDNEDLFNFTVDMSAPGDYYLNLFAMQNPDEVLGSTLSTGPSTPPFSAELLIDGVSVMFDTQSVFMDRNWASIKLVVDGQNNVMVDESNTCSPNALTLVPSVGSNVNLDYVYWDGAEWYVHGTGYQSATDEYLSNFVWTTTTSQFSTFSTTTTTSTTVNGNTNQNVNVNQNTITSTSSYWTTITGTEVGVSQCRFDGVFSLSELDTSLSTSTTDDGVIYFYADGSPAINNINSSVVRFFVSSGQGSTLTEVSELEAKTYFPNGPERAPFDCPAGTVEFNLRFNYLITYIEEEHFALVNLDTNTLYAQGTQFGALDTCIPAGNYRVTFRQHYPDEVGPDSSSLFTSMGNRSSNITSLTMTVDAGEDEWSWSIPLSSATSGSSTPGGNIFFDETFTVSAGSTTSTSGTTSTSVDYTVEATFTFEGLTTDDVSFSEVDDIIPEADLVSLIDGSLIAIFQYTFSTLASATVFSDGPAPTITVAGVSATATLSDPEPTDLDSASLILPASAFVCALLF